VRRLAAVIGLALWAVAGRGSAGAAERGPVPSFTVFGLDGTPAASMEFAGHGSRVLLYVRPGSAHARELLRLLASDEGAASGREGLLVVVGAAGPQAGRLRDSFPGLAASWYADPGDRAFAALGLHAAPVFLGLREGRIEWTLQGPPAGPAAVPSIVKAWLRP